MCAAPRAGTTDRRGTRYRREQLAALVDQRAVPLVRRGPGPRPVALRHARLLRPAKTTATTPSGQAKDKFHFTYDTDVWVALSQGGSSPATARSSRSSRATPPRRIVVAFTDGLAGRRPVFARGDEILPVDGADAVNGGTQADVDTLNAGLFPDTDGRDPHVHGAQHGRRHSAP